MIQGHTMQERTPTRLKLIFRSTNGNSASYLQDKKTRLIPDSQNLGFGSQKLEFVNHNLGNPEISENLCKIPAAVNKFASARV